LQVNVNLAFNTTLATTYVTWFPDIVAKHHMTPNLTSMMSLEP
jgi:cyanate permease